MKFTIVTRRIETTDADVTIEAEDEIEARYRVAHGMGSPIVRKQVVDMELGSCLTLPSGGRGEVNG